MVQDMAEVTKGLKSFTEAFIKSKGIRIPSESIRPKPHPSGPYTNVLLLNLKKLRRNSILMDYIELLRKSENIYKYRWGDLPLWGDVLHYILPFIFILAFWPVAPVVIACAIGDLLYHNPYSRRRQR